MCNDIICCNVGTELLLLATGLFNSGHFSCTACAVFHISDWRKKTDNKIRIKYLRPVTSSNAALQVFPFSLFLWFCSWITQPIFPDRLFLQSKGQCTVNFSFESSNLHLLPWGNIVWPDSGIFHVTLDISLANSCSSSCMECPGPQVFLSMPTSSKHFKPSDCLFYSFILFNEALIIPFIIEDLVSEYICSSHSVLIFNTHWASVSLSSVYQYEREKKCFTVCIFIQDR